MSPGSHIFKTRAESGQPRPAEPSPQRVLFLDHQTVGALEYILEGAVALPVRGFFKGHNLWTNWI